MCDIFGTFVALSLLSPLLNCFGIFTFFSPAFPFTPSLKFTGMVAKLIFMLLQSSAVGEEYGFRN